MWGFPAGHETGKEIMRAFTRKNVCVRLSRARHSAGTAISSAVDEAGVIEIFGGYPPAYGKP